MMKNVKMNDKGRLLAIIAVFAMVFAGAAVAMSEGVDAGDPPTANYTETAVPENAHALESGDTITDPSKPYYAAESISVTINVTTLETTTEIYVLSGKTITITGADTNTKAVKVVTYYVVGSGETAAKKYLGGGTDTNVILSQLKKADSVKITPTIGAAGDDGTASSMKISGNATSDTAALTFALGTLADVGKGAITVDKSLAINGLPEDVEPVTAAYATSASGIITLYEKIPATVNFTSTGEVDWVAFSKENEALTVKVNVTTDVGTTNFSLKESGITSDLVFLAPKDATPVLDRGEGTVVTLEKGYARTYYESDAPQVFQYAGLLNGVAKAPVAPATTPTEYYAQIYYKHSETAAEIVGPYNIVKGTVTQKANVDLTKAGVPIVVASGDKLIINDGITVKLAAAAAIEGTVELYGALVDVDAPTTPSAFTPAADTDVVYIGPSAYTNFTYDCSGEETDVSSQIQNIAKDGHQTELGGQIKEDTNMGDMIVKAGGLEILAGKTLTVTGDLGLNGQTLTVNGKLVVTGSIYSTALTEPSSATVGNKLVIGSNGSVVIEGSVAVNTYVSVSLIGDDDSEIAFRGVTGLDYSTVKDGDATISAISGTVEKEAKSYADVKPTVYVFTAGSAAAVTEPLVISSGVTMVLGDPGNTGTLKTSANGNIEINGNITDAGSHAYVIVGNGTKVSVNGLAKGVSFYAYNGLVLDDDPLTMPVTILIEPGKTKKTTGDNPVSYWTYVSGFSISVDQVKEGTDTVQRVLIDGDLSVGTSDMKAATASETGEKPSLAFGLLGTGSSTIHVAEGDELIIPSTIDVFFGGDGSEIVTVVEGLIKSAGKLVVYAEGASGADAPYIGAHYSIEAGTPKTETHYYEPLDEALDAISLAKNKTVDASVGNIDFDITIGEGQTLRLVREDTVIKSDATVTIENGGKQTDKAFSKILGLFINMNGGTIVTPEEDAYCVMTTNEDGDVIYAGFDGANARSQPGETLVIGDGEAGGNVVMYNGRNYKITGTLEVPADFTVEEGAIVTVDGGTILFKGEKTHNLAVEGLLDADQGSIAKYDEDDATKNKINAAVTGLGFLTLGAKSDVALFDTYNGAGYESADGYVLTSIDLAVLGAAAAGISEYVTIFGNVVWVADIEISEVVIVFNNDKAVLNFAGTVTLDDATIDVDKGTFTGTVTVDTILLGSATAEFTAVKGTLKITDDVGLTLSGEITAGIVSLESGVTYFGDLTLEDAMIMVGEGAAAHVHGETKINKGIFAISGSVIVDNGGRLMLIGGINTVLSTGSLIAQKTETAGSIEISSLRVLGTLKNDGGNVNVNANPSTDGGLFIGAEPTSLGAANGTIAGDITSGVGGGNVIMIYAGADFDEMKIDGAATYKATVFMINGVEYQFLVSSGAADITANILAASDYDLPGYDGTAVLKTIGGWDFGTASPKVGTPALVTATLEKSTVEVTVSPIKGMSIVIDGVTYKNTVPAELKVGTHNLSFTLDPGYKIKDGSSVTLTFNGVKVTNAIIITPDMVGQEPILAASGDIVIDQEIPEQEKQDDTVIIILLAILVVMVVILAIVTILRMMRS